MKGRRLFTVERLESRDTPSGMLPSSVSVATPAIIRGYEEPNQFRSVQLAAVQAPSTASACPSDPSLIRGFNPQPDPPSMRGIIGI
jgi:hypothetical protein